MAKRKTAAAQPGLANVGLLVLRVWLGVSLFAKHGLEKILHFSEMRHHFPDPIHVGPTVGLIFALIADALCSVLIAIGLATRVAAAIEVINLAVVFVFMHHYSFAEEHAETVYLYLGGYLAILLCGAGRYALDRNIRRR